MPKSRAESRHSTVRLWFADAADVPRVREELQRMGCDSEVDGTRLVAVDVPPTVPYRVVRSYFDRDALAGRFEFEEGCLGQARDDGSG